MNKNTYRTLIVCAVLVLTAIYIYPTIGWMTLSPDERQERLDTWQDEDAVYEQPSYWKDTWKSIRRWAQFDRSKVVNLGLDLQGGIHMVLGFELTPEQEEKGYDEEYLQQQVLQRIRRRINEFEAKDPVIQAMGSNKIQIQLPGERRIERAKQLIMKTAFLTFHLVAGPEETVKLFDAIEDHPKFDKRFTPFLRPPEMPGRPFRVPVENIDRVKAVVDEVNAMPDLMPEGKMLALSEPPKLWDPKQVYLLYLMGKEPLITGEGLRMALPRPDNDHPGKYMILFENSAESARRFGEVTEANIGKEMAIVLDGVVSSAPVIQSKITRHGQITGNFTGPESNDLAIALNSGAMPVPVYEEYTGVVGASLGSDSIRQGVNASIAGLIAVVAFMLLYYRVGGIVANIALFFDGLIMLAAFAYFGLTLTLPGIAGFVLTLGMAVDANVLIFERVREELLNGKSLAASIDLGYKRATVTILDANVTTLIAALVLLQFGTGPVQGFGTALAIGICTSVFTALVLTKTVFDVVIERKWLAKFTMMSLIKPGTKIPFIGFRNKGFVLSGVVILAGLGVFFGRGYENNLGVDFASGTNMFIRLASEDNVDIGDVRARLDAAGFSKAVVQEYGEGGEMGRNKFAVRMSEIQSRGENGAEQADLESRVKDTLAPLCAATADPDNVVIEKVDSVGPAIGSQLRLDAAKAMFYAMVFMIAYMWFRYNLVFGITGVIALFHDSIIAIGILSLAGRHIDMNVIAALLTIVGYSINDTVVVYDRIRENMQLSVGRGLHLSEIMNAAINQTLGRTLLTSFTTLLTVVMLFIFGGPVINDFAFCLIVGVIVGTYSSIFVASALAYVFQTLRRPHMLKPAPAKASPAKGKGAKGKGAKGKGRKGAKASRATA